MDRNTSPPNRPFLSPQPQPTPLPTQTAPKTLQKNSSIIEQYPELRPSVLGKLLQNFTAIHGSTVLGVAVWILGEYALEPSLMGRAFEEVSCCV